MQNIKNDLLIKEIARQIKELRLSRNLSQEDVYLDTDIHCGRLEQGKNPEYWVKKIQRNIDRDDEKDKELLFQGWTVIHFWGKDIITNTDECVRVIEETILDIKLSEVGGV